MIVSIEIGPEFKRQFKRLAKKYHSLMSIESKGKGKSGGARILTFNILIDVENMEITLLTIYDKNEISNVNDEYIKFLIENL